MEVEKKQVFEDKYDRQIRLWGSNGQQKLKNSKILLLNCEPSGVETIKNLVLPGVGNICIVDNQNVTDKDLGKNFFMAQENKGQNRAKTVFNNMVEMNPDVQGEFREEDPNEIASNEEFLSQFTLIVACELQDKYLKILSNICHTKDIALVIINTCGFFGRIRVQNGVHAVIESKPLQARYYDLRINQPFPELQQLADSFNIQGLDEQIQQGVSDGDSGKAMDQLQHIPYSLILIKALQKYRVLHHGVDPKTFADKKALKEIIKQMGAKLENPGNFEQAESFTYQALYHHNTLHQFVNGGVQRIFSHPNIKDHKDEFWVLAKALKLFYEHNGRLPISSNLPDMESSTQNYLKLKEVYKHQFECDMQMYKQTLGETSIPEENIKVFLQNVCYLGVYDYKPYFEELTTPTELEIMVNYNEMGEEIINQNYQWIIGYRGLNSWMDKHEGKYPQYQKDEDSLYEEIENVRKTCFTVVGPNAEAPINKNIAEEFCRVNDAKLHNIAAIMGGVASQEAVKLITHQFQPLNNTFVYDGNYSISQTLTL